MLRALSSSALHRRFFGLDHLLIHKFMSETRRANVARARAGDLTWSEARRKQLELIPEVELERVLRPVARREVVHAVVALVVRPGLVLGDVGPELEEEPRAGRDDVREFRVRVRRDAVGRARSVEKPEYACDDS